MKSASLIPLLAAVASAQQPTIVVDDANVKPLPLAVAAPLTPDEAARKVVAELDSALMYDFSACGLFDVLDRKSFLASPTEGLTAAAIAFNTWLEVGAQGLVKTQLTVEGDTARVELRLFGVPSGREELKVTESGPVKDLRRVAHRLANAVYRSYTRREGPFETRITFSRKSGGGGRDIWVADWDGHNAVRVTQGDLNLIPTFTPTGAVAFTSYRQRRPFLFVGRPQETPRLLVGIGNMVTGASFSPDGKRLAVSVSEGENAEIYVGNADGSEMRRLTDTKYFLNTSPTWAPDGKRLAFVSNRGGAPQIYIVNADGTGTRRLTIQGNYNTTPAWSPRGDLIAFTARDERNAFDLFTVAVDGGKVTRLTQDASNNEEPAFSPDGRLILFTSTRTGSRHLHVMTSTGNNQVPLPIEKGDYSTPDWGK